MARSANKVTFIFLVAFAITIPCLEAGIAEFDDFLKAQASEAQVIALKSYQPDPINVTAEFNIHVHRALMEEENDTRRELKQKYHGPCMATNPIDSCWRCRKHWAQDRFRETGSSRPTTTLQRKSHRHYASPEVWSKWQWKSENDLFINGATFLQSGAPLGKLPFNKGLMMKPRPGAEASRLTRFAGTLNCKLGKPC
ncbi:putative pectate lyase 3 [Glycine max]|uniref:probable pectate lyase 3 n=1 Tax=Glycine max TaxID=3847 RepID=UPI00023C9862|nr:probable pectate lyase 3 [Glycine max]KAH1234855.1 putative pectate lyase 3 [Glycine max]|eukprot:XP_006588322.1 probable pectate lyase 3 [Glycine max]